MERLTILKQRLMRSVITVALVLACAMAWAETVETYYILRLINGDTVRTQKIVVN